VAWAGSSCENGVGPALARAAAPVPPPDRDEQAAFRFDPRFFARRSTPVAGDQTFFAYVTGRPVRPTAGRRTLVLQPLGCWTDRQRRVLDSLVEFSALFFALPARIAPPLQLPAFGYRQLDSEAGPWVQYQTGALLDRVLAANLPGDAAGYLGVTMVDLYPAPAWGYVFGEASLARRIGVTSLVRHTAAFAGQADSAAAHRLFLRRSFKALAHETGHMFSMRHCQAFDCLMNASTTLDDLDRSPGWLCPACLRKLQWNLGFSVGEQHRRLAGFYRRNALADWASWMEARARALG
jgi:archaemetzincin